MDCVEDVPVIFHTLTPLFVPFTKSIHWSPSTHITFTSLSFSDFALNAFLTPSSHLVQGLPAYLLPQAPTLLLSTTPHSYATHIRTTTKLSDLLSLFFFLAPNCASLFSHSFLLPRYFVFITLSLCLIYPHYSAPYVIVGIVSFSYRFLHTLIYTSDIEHHLHCTKGF